MSTTEINLSLTLSTRHGGHYQIVSSDAPALFKMPVDSGYEIDKAKEACKFATYWSSEPRASARGYFDDVSILSLFSLLEVFLCEVLLHCCYVEQLKLVVIVVTATESSLSLQ